ncbi:hypothetical protein ACY3WP_000937 [Acinetobacter baumannii]|uniref:hypothetical protein n=1 Tax=Acinetobacter baumannii TaxID=470 RepID=UPI0004619B0C|nr:hypothetical protein [Acinetobacter baumannii]EHU2144853.1 hypothetical protein [Acinetobacter baumannii]EHU2722100.1 hypothetical protein [Acinetobacter baumannii]EKX0534368.1 hypothetical protein [Acinetobacter baumannii]EKX0538031.1 hypothetical protein [Acinetobacter baumannii]EKY1461625.1 hypothetical protein [Acinetobacter baumannii]
MNHPSYHVLHIYSQQEQRKEIILVELNYQKIIRDGKEFLEFKSLIDNFIFYVETENYEVHLNAIELGFNELSKLYLVAIDKDLTEFGRKHSQGTEKKIQTSKNNFISQDNSSSLGDEINIKEPKMNLHSSNDTKIYKEENGFIYFFKLVLKSKTFWISLVLLFLWQNNVRGNIPIKVNTLQSELIQSKEFADKVLPNIPADAKYICSDGSYTFSENQGRCSYHDGSTISTATLKANANVDIEERVNNYKVDLTNSLNKQVLFILFIIIILSPIIELLFFTSRNKSS